MRQWLMCLALLLGACTSLRDGIFSYEDVLGTRTCRIGEDTWPDVFPKYALPFELGPQFFVMVHDERVRLLSHCWHSSVIVNTFGEGPLFPAAPGTETYRFTWMRSFNDYVLIRVTQFGPVHSLHVKMGDLRDGDLLIDQRILLTPSQWQEFRRRLEQARFWSADRYFLDGNFAYTDGAAWLLEGVRGGSYHALDVHSPEREGPAGAFRAACLYLVELSGISIPAKDVF